ncbi:MAG: bis(5'-nucleosyl)-tetraphosphatase (symmetrical) YqeK [Clostridia bacterium]|nr:bis(5'-nucleosyl)-tetraphosphatase (symmetrical) YqeK [Clostridia bacterium]
MMKIEDYIKILEGRLTKKRFIHSLAVADEAKRLAEKYGGDVDRAYLAGLLHDIMKDAPPQEQLEAIDASGVQLAEIERMEPKLWHAIAGACYVEKQGLCDDAEIISAIRCHTTGKPSMTLLEQILYVADFTSAERDYDGADIMRQACNESLEIAMFEGARYSLNSVLLKCGFVHIDSLLMYNELAIKLVGYTPRIKI